jgi:hypothetical protein
MIRLALALAVLGACGDDGGNAGVDAGRDAASADAPPLDGPPVPLGVLFINEVMPSNTAACMDVVGEFDDWVELYNKGATSIDLGGFTITDDPTMPTKVTLSAGVTVPAHGYLLLWADNQVQGLDHLAFKLDASAESITLFAPGGTQLDTYAWTTAAPTDTSYARVPDGTGPFITSTTPTCGATNGAP